MAVPLIRALLVGFVIGVAGCTNADPEAASVDLMASGGSGEQEAVACPVTLPNDRRPAADPLSANHGNDAGTLFTGLWDEGTVVFEPGGPGHILPDGSLSMKWPWARQGVSGTLEITGRRLDAAAPPLRVDIVGGGGEFGFQPTTLIFPTEGCWEVTGKTGGAELTFVTRVVKVMEQ